VILLPIRPLTNIEKTEPKARPDQLYEEHAIAMLKQLPEIWSKTKPKIIHLIADSVIDKELMLEILYKAINVTIFSHDFGKLSPAFQLKIMGESLSNTEQKLSYHCETGALFSKILFLQLMEDQHKEIYSNKIITSLSSVIYYVVLMHHQSVLRNNSEAIFSTDEVNRVQKIISMIFDEYTENSLIEILMKVIKELDENNRKIFNQEILEKTFDQFKQLSLDEDLLVSIIDEVENDYCELGLENEHNQVSAEIFFLIEYLSSILCDLDEWDAKFFYDNKKELTIATDEIRTEYPKELITQYREEKLTEWKSTNELMSNIRNTTYLITDQLEVNNIIGQMKTLTAPTGSAKTLALLNLGFKLRAEYYEKKKVIPKIIYCLPFISITDQVADQIRDVMKLSKSNIQTPQLTVHHNLATIQWNEFEDPDKFNKYILKKNRYFIKLWRSDVIVTTFVRFWESILGCRKSEVIRFHRIANSIIIFDEIQAIPIKFWSIIYQSMKHLSENFGCTIITATATQPLIIPPEEKDDLVEQDSRAVTAYQQLNRYSIAYSPEPIPLSNFIEETIIPKLNEKNPKNKMVVLNTKRSATQTALRLNENIEENNLPFEIYFLSRNVIPADREVTLRQVKKKLAEKNNDKKCLLVCTQLVEAGVDISFDQVFRDFSPLTSIIQIAGRCNRGMEIGENGVVEVVTLLDEVTGRTYASYIYDKIELEKTHEILTQQEKYNEKYKRFDWNEVELRKLCDRYYEELSRTKITTESLKYLHELKFNSLSKSFKLIEEIPEETIFIKRNEEAKKILDNIMSKKEGKKTIPKQFYQYTLEITKKDFAKIDHELIPYPDERKPKFWILKTDYYYNEKWGLNPDKIGE